MSIVMYYQQNFLNLSSSPSVFIRFVVAVGLRLGEREASVEVLPLTDVLFEDGERVSLSVEDVLVERDHVIIAEQEEQVLERLRQKEALLRVVLLRCCRIHISVMDRL